MGFLLGHRRTDQLHIQHAASTSPSVSCACVTSHRDAGSVPLPGGACAGLQLTRLPNSLKKIDTPKVTTVSHSWESWTHTGRSGHGLVGMRCKAETQRELGHLLQQKQRCRRRKGPGAAGSAHATTMSPPTAEMQPSPALGWDIFTKTLFGEGNEARRGRKRQDESTPRPHPEL